jgi:hypothetical protein
VDASLAPNLPVGDLKFYDNYIPALEAGNWRIEVSHTLLGIDTGELGVTQEFVVSAPQFAIDPSAVVSHYPPDGSVGLYGQTLPHIVLKDAMLPWERRMSGAAQAPWLALLVLEEGELTGAAASPTRTQLGTVRSFIDPDPAIFKPSFTKENDVAWEDPCRFIQISTDVFMKVTPRLDELRFLAHCRQSNTTDKAHQGFDQNGLFSVVVASRFPAMPVAGESTPVKSIVHLVSLEGLESLLVDRPDFAGRDWVALVSLASWTFQSLPDHQEDFRGLMEQILRQEFDGANYDPAKLWLRLPIPSPAIGASTNAEEEVSRRIRDGFVPMQYKLRTGEQTFAWYRGPFAPILTTPLNPPGPFLTADSALIYQRQFGVFDTSLAAAWEMGRALALADRGFGQALFDFRRRGHQLTDALLHRLQSDAFSADEIADLTHDVAVQDEFLRILDEDLLKDIGAPPASDHKSPGRLNVDPTDPKTAVQNFLADPNVEQKIVELLRDDLDPVASWLGRLLLLYPVPFNLMVPDSRMLEMETLRFFYIDNNWLRCLQDGALSIGMESSRATFFHDITRDLMYRSAMHARRDYRAQLFGVDPPVSDTAENLVTGFLLRSAVVSGWPNLAVRGGEKDGTSLKILRLDRLAANLMLGLFWGVPDFIEFSEPQEGFRFGVDDDGRIPLRQPVVVADGPELGAQLDKRWFQVLPKYLRPNSSRVLKLAPTVSDGLLQGLQAALPSLADIGPSDFALQMIKSPEAIRFNTQVK